MSYEKRLKNIKTVESTTEFNYKEKGSQFIGLCVPVETLEGAEQLYLSTKKKNYDATHNCFAYKLSSNQIRYSDDGEPNGTGGIRILNAIDHFDLTDVIVIVTRYFGGTKLGVGPLGKAYYNAAFEAINKNTFYEKYPFKLIKISIIAEYISVIYHLINIYKGKITSSEFDSAYIISVIIPLENEKIFASDCINQTNGKVSLEIDEKIMYFRL